MSKRLEEITSSVGISLSGDGHVLLRRKHYEWLIEQVKRVADYEKRYEKHLDIDIRNGHKIQCLEYQIKRYRQQISRLKSENEELAVAYNNAQKEIRVLKNKLEGLI